MEGHFRVLEFPPTPERKMWAYTTCGMSSFEDQLCSELHIFSDERDQTLIDSLIVIAHFHRFRRRLGNWYTINWGRGWRLNSSCPFALLSQPYLYWTKLEILDLEDGKPVFFYWLVPITKEELVFKKEYGANRFGETFEEKGLNYLNPFKSSLI